MEFQSTIPSLLTFSMILTVVWAPKRHNVALKSVNYRSSGYETEYNIASDIIREHNFYRDKRPFLSELSNGQDIPYLYIAAKKEITAKSQVRKLQLMFLVVSLRTEPTWNKEREKLNLAKNKNKC